MRRLFEVSRPRVCIAGGLLSGALAAAVHRLDAYAIAYAVILILSIWFGRTRWIGALKGRLHWLSVVLLGSVTAFIPITVAAAMIVLGHFGNVGSAMAPVHDVPNGTAMLLLSPFAETYIFQGWLQTTLYYVAKKVAVPVTVIAFTFGHSLDALPWFFTCALLLLLLRHYSKSLGTVIVAHLTINVLILIATRWNAPI